MKTIRSQQARANNGRRVQSLNRVRALRAVQGLSVGRWSFPESHAIAGKVQSSIISASITVTNFTGSARYFMTELADANLTVALGSNIRVNDGATVSIPVAWYINKGAGIYSGMQAALWGASSGGALMTPALNTHIWSLTVGGLGFGTWGIA